LHRVAIVRWLQHLVMMVSPRLLLLLLLLNDLMVSAAHRFFITTAATPWLDGKHGKQVVEN